MFKSPSFKAELKFRSLYFELQKHARNYEHGCKKKDGSGFEPYKVVWDVLPDNWKGVQPICPFFVATCPDELVPRLLFSIHKGEVHVWDVEGFTKQ